MLCRSDGLGLVTTDREEPMPMAIRTGASHPSVARALPENDGKHNYSSVQTQSLHA
jgi:hypothetical protein